MHIVEEDRYLVACYIDRRDLKAHGIVMDDLINRTPLGHIFIKNAGKLAKDSTEYAWPGCGMTMRMEFYDGQIILRFSERVEDYVQNLRESSYALEKDQAEGIEQLIWLILQQTEEEKARDIIRSFENNVRDAGEQLTEK